MKARKSANKVCFQLACAAAWLACCGPLTQSAGAAVLDLGAFVNSGETTSQGFGITDTGRATGDSNVKAFRTGTNAAIYDYPQSGDNVHNTLTNLLQTQIVSSFAYDIWQASTDTQIELVGEYAANGTNRPYWYYESANGKTKYARILYTNTGAANVVKPATSGGGASVVVGFIFTNSHKHAAYWSVIPTNHWLYDYGQIYFPNEDSVATDTDRNRTVGFRGSDPAFHAFIIDGTAYALAEPPGATATVAIGMCPSGSVSRVVGFALDGTKKPILWTYSGNGQSSYTLLTLPPNKLHGEALGINDAGDIVGSAWTAEIPVACRWNSGSVIVLNDYSGGSEWSLQRAIKVSSTAGGRKIVGFGLHTIGSSQVLRGFVFN